MIPLDQPISTEPTIVPVNANDLIGRWQFYIDSRSVTVRIEFFPDGTFSQTLMVNRGGRWDCQEGTWTIEESMVHLEGYVSVVDGACHSRTWWFVDLRKGVTLFGGDGEDPEKYFAIRRQR